MRRPWQYTLLGAAIAFFVLYGIELSSDGIEDVYGPLERQAPAGARLPAADSLPAGRQQTERYGIPAGQGEDAAAPGPDIRARGAETSGWLADEHGFYEYGNETEYGQYPDYGTAPGGGAVGRLADGTAGVLQSVSNGGIRLIVSLFESVTR